MMVTLAAYCLAHGLDMHGAGETELARIWTKVEQIRAKQATKPVGSALPVAQAAALLSADSKAGGEPVALTCDTLVRVTGSEWPPFMAPQRMLAAGTIVYPHPPAAQKPLTVADGFLCRAWGETELTAAELVSDWDGVRRFMVREWLGSEDATNHSGVNSLDLLKADFDEHEEDKRGGPLSYEFEIGGVSVERVCAHGITGKEQQG